MTFYSQVTKAKTQKCQQLPQKISKCSQTKKANKKITITQVQIIGGKKAKMMSNSSNLWIKVLQFNFKKSKAVHRTTNISSRPRQKTKKIASSNYSKKAIWMITTRTWSWNIKIMLRMVSMPELLIRTHMYHSVSFPSKLTLSHNLTNQQAHKITNPNQRANQTMMQHCKSKM